MEEIDLNKALDELIKQTDAPEAAALENTTQALPTDPPEATVLENTTEALEAAGPREPNRRREPQFAGVDPAALAAGRAGLAQWPQSLLPLGGRV